MDLSKIAQRFGGAAGLGPGVLGPDWALPLLSRFLESTWSKARARSPLRRSSTVIYLLAGKYCSSRSSHGIVLLSCEPRVPVGSSHCWWQGCAPVPLPSPVNCTECGRLPHCPEAAEKMQRLAALLSRTHPLWSGQGYHQYFPGDTVVKNLPANARDSSLIPGSRISSGVGNGNPFQYSCLKNPMGRGAWQATAHGIVKSRTQLSILHMVRYWYLSKDCVFHSVLSMVALLYHVINGKQMPRECKWLTWGHNASYWWGGSVMGWMFVSPSPKIHRWKPYPPTWWGTVLWEMFMFRWGHMVMPSWWD